MQGSTYTPLTRLGIVSNTKINNNKTSSSGGVYSTPLIWLHDQATAIFHTSNDCQINDNDVDVVAVVQDGRISISDSTTIVSISHNRLNHHLMTFTNPLDVTNGGFFHVMAGKFNISSNHGVGTGGSDIVIGNNCVLDFFDGSYDHNTSDEGQTGFTMLDGAKRATIVGGTFSNNVTKLNGAALNTNANFSGTIAIEKGTFSGNKADLGGSIYIGPNASDIQIDGVGGDIIFSDDKARVDGGAIYIADFSKILKFGPNLKFSMNKAGRYFYKYTYVEVNGTASQLGVLDSGAVNATGITCSVPFAIAFNNADVNIDNGELLPWVDFVDPAGAVYVETMVEPLTNGLVPTVSSPSKPGEVFDGWYTAPTGGVKWDFANMKAEDYIPRGGTYGYGQVLYAHWRASGSGGGGGGGTSSPPPKRGACYKRWHYREPDRVTVRTR